MDDKDKNNDEYHFEDMDSTENKFMGESDSESPSAASDQSRPDSDKKDVYRNVASVVVVILLLVLSYKLIGYLFSSKPKPSTTSSLPQLAQTAKKAPVEETTVQPQPVVPQVEVDTELKQKVTAIEVSQDTVKTEMGSVTDKVTMVNTNLNTLNEQITKLNKIIENLSTQVSRQSDEINVLMARTRPKPVQHVFIKNLKPQIIYYVQAVIPGRAWLIGTNGSTLTVREGTKIPGYGVVRLVDSLQGKVITSSGKIIRFSQEDS